ncbi:MAG: response regulator [Methylococcaceae bacterium]|nr:response regulator [Methylococcaceae bacterium]
MNSTKPVLLIEDDSVDIMTVKRCFKRLKIPNELWIAENGEEALKILDSSTQVSPCIILLDINMPKMNGLEFLEKFKKRKISQKTPVIMLTSSKEESDIDHCFTLGVAGYILKPVEYNEFVETIELLNAYWSKSELPE